VTASFTDLSDDRVTAGAASRRLSATYRYLGQATWPSPPYAWQKLGKNGWSGPGPISEQVLLAQALVSGPGMLP
jgi:hypothetical protein